MDFNRFKKPVPQRQNQDNCKIKIKNTKTGREISFQGNCSREQLSMAREGFIDKNTEVEEEE